MLEGRMPNYGVFAITHSTWQRVCSLILRHSFPACQLLKPRCDLSMSIQEAKIRRPLLGISSSIYQTFQYLVRRMCLYPHRKVKGHLISIIIWVWM